MTRELVAGAILALIAVCTYGMMITDGIGSYPLPQRDLSMALPEIVAGEVVIDQNTLYQNNFSSGDSREELSANPFNLTETFEKRGALISMPSPNLPVPVPPPLVLWEGQ